MSVNRSSKKNRYEAPSEDSSASTSYEISTSESSSEASSTSSDVPVKKKISSLGKRAYTVGRPNIMHGEKANWTSLSPEIRTYLLQNFIADATSSYETEVMRLRTYGAVSKKNYADMVAVLNSPGFEALGMCSTQLAFPKLATFDEGEKNRKAQFKQRIVEMIQTYHVVFADLSKNWSRDFAPGLRPAGVSKLFENHELRQVRIDISNYRIHIGMHDRKTKIMLHDMGKQEAKKAVRDSEAKLLVETLNTAFSKLALNGNGMPVVELLCRDQPFASVVRPLVKNLARYCTQLPQLQALDLSCTSKDEKICEGRLGTPESALLFGRFVGNLVTILASSPSLQELKLSMNGIRPEGLKRIANALAQNKTIKLLDLSWNGLASNPSNKIALRDGLKSFATALAENTSLQRLDLSFCEIDDKSADYLCKAFAKNKVLEFIDMTGNKVTPKHALLKDPRVDYRGKKTATPTASPAPQDASETS